MQLMLAAEAFLPPPKSLFLRLIDLPAGDFESDRLLLNEEDRSDSLLADPPGFNVMGTSFRIVAKFELS